MKLSIVFLLFVAISFAANAGLGDYYSSASLDEYDPDTGLYFKTYYHKTEKEGFFSKSSESYASDIFIYNPKTETGKLLFNDEGIRYITDVLFETGYNNSEQKIEFSGQSSDDKIKNNFITTERKPKNKLLLLELDKERKTYTFWVCDKTGNNLKKVLSLAHDFDWHLDVANSKIRFISNSGNTFKVKNLEW